MLLNLINGSGDMRSYVMGLLLSLPIILLALSLHETAHGYVAYRLGDPTARNLGRLTLNPIKHLDPIGFLCMLFAGFGWANPVPINTRNFKNPRRDLALSAAAGPASNLLLALLFTALYKVFLLVVPNLRFTEASYDTAVIVVNIVAQFICLGISLNVSLAVFNLLPVPPLDGSRLFYVFLPPKYYFGVMKYERYISLGIMILLLVGVLDPVLSFVRGGIINLFFLIFGI